MTGRPLTDRLRHTARSAIDRFELVHRLADQARTEERSTDQEPTRVAIACQGGGSHAAFTAGVLARLLSDRSESYTVTGFSGTSGGAVCATAAWYGWVSEAHEPGDVLEAIWTDIAANDWVDRWVNEWLVATNSLRDGGGGVPAFSPYVVPASNRGRRRLHDVLTTHIDFEDFASLEATTDPPLPQLVLGAVDVTAGALETFTLPEITPETVLASATLPTLFEGVEIDERTYWDGLFAMNPPIMDLVVGRHPQPDELWVIQLNPQTYPEEPTSLSEINQRINELTGNLSLQQQRRFLDRLNRWANEGELSERGYTRTTVRTIGLPRSAIESSKIDRRPSVIWELMDAGADQAATFLEQLDTHEE
jgi:NTE family protein